MQEIEIICQIKKINERKKIRQREEKGRGVKNVEKQILHFMGFLYLYSNLFVPRDWKKCLCKHKSTDCTLLGNWIVAKHHWHFFRKKDLCIVVYFKRCVWRLFFHFVLLFCWFSLIENCI